METKIYLPGDIKYKNNYLLPDLKFMTDADFHKHMRLFNKMINNMIDG